MTDILISNGTPIIVANSGDYNPTAGTGLTGTRTHQINLTSLAANAYRQSDKFDFGATRAARWVCRAAIEPTSAPTAYGITSIFVGFSDSSTAGYNNPGNLSGADGAWNGYGAASTDADECVGQLVRVGGVVASADADVMIGDVGIVIPWMRYGIVVVKNGYSVALKGNAIQMSIQFWPLVDSF